MWVIQSWVFFALMAVIIIQLFIFYQIFKLKKTMENSFVELKDYVAKNIVSADDVQNVVNVGINEAKAGLVAEILAEAKIYTDGKDLENDSEASKIVAFANAIATKVNAIGAIVGVEVVEELPVVDEPVSEEPSV